MKVRFKIDLFKKDIIDQFKDRVKCILLTGSYARNEAIQKSDIDMWIFLDKVEFEDLKQIAEIVNKLDPEPKLNPQCVSFKEAQVYHFMREYSPIQYNTDGIILYGELKIAYPSNKEFINQSKRLASYVIMGIRHFVTTCEKDHVLIKKKLRKRVLKPLMWAIRYKYAVILGAYLKNLKDLKPNCTRNEKKAIDIYINLLSNNEKQYMGKSIEILKLCEKLCEDLLNINYDKE